MNTTLRYTAADLPALINRISKNTIGMDEYFDRIVNIHETTANYPPYNHVQLSSTESRLELALAGFKKSELQVYTECGKLFVEGQKEDKETNINYFHKGLAHRNFKRVWTLSEDIEVNNVNFEDGLLIIHLKKIVPEHHSRKKYM